MSGLYDEDIVLWSERQADLLRRVAAGEPVNEAPDWACIVEEIESVGASERAALASHVGTVIEHLMKLETSPASGPWTGWQETIIRARADATALLEDSPSLRRTLDAAITRALRRRRLVVAGVLALYGETPRVPLENISYTRDQVLGDWFPGSV